ncbi:phosphoglycolate phosphatase [Mycobacteroides abscessus subsp. bolletii]|nr:phosphoglycolate phosphatase [Mycobacteroides abscessus subsp. bolletii]
MKPECLSRVRCVVFDVGETLIDETRMWADLAFYTGLTPLTVCGVLGAAIAQGLDHSEVWDLIGVDAPEFRADVVMQDFYPDALGCIAAVRRAGFVVGVAGNQPAGVEDLLRKAGLEADFVASSAAWGVAKPDPGFFSRVIFEAKMPASNILYVGDRLDNDVLPAHAAGMRTGFIRRGPWGHIHALKPEAGLADLQIKTLSELTELLCGSTDT